MAAQQPVFCIPHPKDSKFYLQQSKLQHCLDECFVRAKTDGFRCQDDISVKHSTLHIKKMSVQWKKNRAGGEEKLVFFLFGLIQEYFLQKFHS